ncbi:nicotinate-nucleotide--dimethylbenzimidazole phosphoribosyltransferase [Corynebacterium pseudodiphtheriticum]|uniref:nicotinate-nucleotide--dimethylbenzimidazole phosphoribosyltransferase n=1 Tax=Corynebacterium pseudodiphtheriticum TaxID=37637 RepID=UPI00234C63D7|nr:nicotinate-nucleotide--dimethylbenzimidazole phosphoribosyltransferase [Corynebacterium pseudodiphtheriticum]MDC7109838.1 nicotinate-nucleotide--dimethylbenzimidazole phosphoribosyltransferase [Corynebacterium pseudodiphtheriticum]MDC7114147.1 nicotinate-nucleotide--dimethylbenzimidazole phosphoribosyltransferase [Corynebacterium pseudodiphtheriticum]
MPMPHEPESFPQPEPDSAPKQSVDAAANADSNAQADSAEFADLGAPAVIDTEAAAAVVAAMSSTQRGRSFGRLTDAAAFMAACQGKVPAEPLRQPRVVIFHSALASPAPGSSDPSVSVPRSSATGSNGASSLRTPESQTAADDIAAGSAPVTTLARTHGAGVRLEEIPTDGAALEFGRSIADSEIDAGADLLIPGELTEGFSVEAAALFGAITKTEPVALASLEASLTTKQWQADVTAIRDHMFRFRRYPANLLDLVRECQMPTVQSLVGFILQATSRRTPVLVDGCLATVCGLIAEKIVPGTQPWLRSAQLSPEPAHIQAVQQLGLTPLLAFDLTTGQGTGGVLALSALNAAIELVADEVYAITDAINAHNHGA